MDQVCRIVHCSRVKFFFVVYQGQSPISNERLSSPYVRAEAQPTLAKLKKRHDLSPYAKSATALGIDSNCRPSLVSVVSRRTAVIQSLPH